ncbi:MAG: ribosome silencing factor [Alphaproteobacteria bacterium]
MAPRKAAPSAPKRLLSLIEETLDQGQGEDISVIDLSGKSSIADYLVIASGRSGRHLTTLADRLVEALREKGIRPVPVEGMANAEWVLVDAGDVIVHLFRPEKRRFYNLEKMWGLDLPDLVEASA